MPTACVFMNKQVLNDRPSPGVAILWTSFEPRLDLVGTLFGSSVCAACPVFAPPVAPYLYCCLHRFLSGYNSYRFGRRTVQFAWSASPTSLSDAWLAARCFHPLHARNICAV